MAPQGVILDIDGTLVLSNDVQAQAWVQAFAEHGYTVPFEHVRPLIGMGGDQLIPQLVSDLTNEDGIGKAIADRRKELILQELGPTLTAANGSRELVQRMQDAGLQLTVASSATSEELGILLKAARVEDLLHETTTADDAAVSKPAPDIVEAALSKAHMEPARVVMLGDTPYDIEAASKAGVDTIALRCGGFSDEQLSGAIAIYNDPADLLQHFDRSPLAEPGAIAPVQTPMSLQTSVAQPLQKGRYILAQILLFFIQSFEVITRVLTENTSAVVTAGLVVFAAIVLRLLFAVLNSLNDLPLVEPFLQLVGIGYSVWFFNRHILYAVDRQEFSQQLQGLKQQVVNSQQLPEVRS